MVLNVGRAAAATVSSQLWQLVGFGWLGFLDLFNGRLPLVVLSVQFANVVQTLHARLAFRPILSHGMSFNEGGSNAKRGDWSTMSPGSNR